MDHHNQQRQQFYQKHLRLKPGKNIFCNVRGEFILDTIILLAFMAMICISFLKLDLSLDKIQYQNMQKFHKKWSNLEQTYGKNR